MDLTLELSDGTTAPAWLSVPTDVPPPWPGVVVIHDLTGLREDTRRHCRNFAAAGYAAIAPDLYDGFKVRCVVRTFRAMADKAWTAPAPIEAARQALLNHPDVDSDRLGVTGFCMGGGFALMAAAEGHYGVAAPFYGVVPRKRERLARICPTLGQYGAEDRLFADDAARLDDDLTALEVPHEVIVYPGVGHSFMNDHPDLGFRLARHTPLRAAHDGPTEAQAWARLLAFFAEHLGTP